MVVEKLTTSWIPAAFELCRVLRENDQHPCSFWAYEVADLEQLLDSDKKSAYICIAAGKVVGIATLARGGRFQEHWAEISIAVHSSYRSAGAGRLLALELEKVATLMGLEFIKALVLENNVSSRNFFSKIEYEHKATLFHEFKIDGFGNLNDCAFYKVL